MSPRTLSSKLKAEDQIRRTFDRAVEENEDVDVLAESLAETVRKNLSSARRNQRQRRKHMSDDEPGFPKEG